MQSKRILFDLDGTVTDSGEGIINCASLALLHFGLPVPDRTAMRVFVGPPLYDTFRDFGVPEDRLQEAVDVYRSRYLTVGKFENFPYPGIAEMLNTLQKHGHELYIATSKPEGLAIEILEHFGLSGYFCRICGATLDRSRLKKAEVITYLLDQVGGTADFMVGDTVLDILGAAQLGIPAIGVSWGYGSVDDMKRAGAHAIADTPAQLLTLLDK